MLPLLRKQRLQARLAILNSADFCFEGRGPNGSVIVGVERKTIPDLIDSLQSGRLQGMQTESGGGQLGRLTATYDYVWLLVEGLWVTDAQGRLCQRRHHGLTPLHGNFTEDSLTKRLLSLALQGGIHIWQTSNREQSARWIASLSKWWNDKAWDEHRTLQMVHTHHGMVPISLFRELVMRLPGIGLAASKAIEQHYNGSLIQLLQSSTCALSGVPVQMTTGKAKRLGAAKAQAVMDAIARLHGR